MTHAPNSLEPRREDGEALGEDALVQRLSQCEAQLEEARQQLRYYSEALRSQAAVMRTLQENADKATRANERKISHYKKDLAQYREHLGGVYRSSSWRLTAPLRRMMGLLRRRPSLSAWELEILAASARSPLSSVDPVEEARKRARTQVSALRRKLLELGFIERASADLEACVSQSKDPYLREIAAWELAGWYANHYSDSGARRCLELLDIVSDQEPLLRKRIAVLRAECQALLGQATEAEESLHGAIGRFGPDPDLFLGLTGLQTSPEAKLEVINRALAQTGLSPIWMAEGEARTPYDALHGEVANEGDEPLPEVRVTVIVPAYNAECTIGTTLRALSVQTWRDLEIIVSDDCSSDRTCDIVEEWAASDTRIKLIRGEANSGPYVARNKALQVSTGMFVTCNDADDWSHPRKIELQARHLLANPAVIANTSEQARVSEDLVFHRRGNPGFYIQLNMSSLMFRSAEVINNLGYWDSVRFAGDSEFTKRIKKAYGRSAIVDLRTGPLSFQRQTDGSLTGSREFGYHGFKMGARREYEVQCMRWHEGDSLYMDFPVEQRPFLAPAPMRLDRDAQDGVREFDVVMVSDFRMPGGTTMSNAEEIKAQKQFGLRTGLVQMGRYDLNPARPVNEVFDQLVDGDRVDWIVHGERVRCRLLILRLPWVLQEWQDYIPGVEAERVVVIVNQPPKRDYAEGSPYLYDLQRCHRHLQRHFGSGGTWYPIGPMVREALETRHRPELDGLEIAAEDWANIIDINEWRRPIRPPRSSRIRICRHSRDQYVKWPANATELLKVYPDSPGFEVHVLGGANTPMDLLGGRLPERWRVKEFGSVHPAKFLAQFDVFVYYTHPDWVESFGRVIFEAMAVGLPVFLPPVYEPVFKQAALYATPDEIQARIEALMADDAAYDAQVRTALDFVESQFGFSRHARRISASTSLTVNGRDIKDVLDLSERALVGCAENFTSLRPDAIAELGLQEKNPTLWEQLLARASQALAAPLHTVTAKTTLPPSGDSHDYWHPAPYWWPDASSPDGLPYIRRDGERVPGTQMFEPESDRYDRTRIQLLFDDALALMLAWRLTARQQYAEKAAAQLEAFFVSPSTRMNPHLEYAQVKLGHNGNLGSSSGIIELKDFYYYLDAVRLMRASGALSEETFGAFRQWLNQYLRWLLFSPQGRAESAATNNHGTYYDLQVAAISAFLDERACLFQALRRARSRFGEQFAEDGSQPEELTRKTTAHYCCYNLQGWINLDRLARQWNIDLWIEPGRPDLGAGMDWLLSHVGKPWPYLQIDQFDVERFAPVVAAREVRSGERSQRFAIQAGKAVFHPHDGIRPWWNLDT